MSAAASAWLSRLAEHTGELAAALDPDEPDRETGQLVVASLAFASTQVTGDVSAGELVAELRAFSSAVGIQVGQAVARLAGQADNPALAALVRELLSDEASVDGHFFEHYLAALDRDSRRARGVFYTPASVAAFVVRRIDAALQELGLPLGLADHRSYRQLGWTAPEGVSDAEPAVLMLDPAAGSGAFLVEVVRLVHGRLLGAWRSEGMDDGQCKEAWLRHVPDRLLPRLCAWEILAPAHALCRLRLGLALRQTGYNGSVGHGPELWCGDALSSGAPRRPFTVVMGNPPYRRSSQNRAPHLSAMLAPYKEALEGERNLQPLSDDYILFIRLAELLLEAVPRGVCGFVTNHTHLTGRLHRGLRMSLKRTFRRIDSIDLGGSAIVAGPGGGRDENLFGIGQGVAVSLWSRDGSGEQCRVRHAVLAGKRLDKLAALDADRVALEEVSGEGPRHPFTPVRPAPQEYRAWLPLTDLFTFHSVAGKPGDDGLLVGFDTAAVLAQVSSARAALEGGAGGGTTEAARKLAALPQFQAMPDQVRPYLYRPFDVRRVYDDERLWTRPVRRLRAHLDGGPALLTTRMVKDAVFHHVFVSRGLPDVIGLSSRSSVNCYVFPMSGLAGQAGRWGRHPEQLFHYLYAVLHSPHYRRRYGEELRSDFPRVPRPPADPLFTALESLGRRLAGLHLMEEEPQSVAGFEDGGDRRVLRLQRGSAPMAKDRLGRGAVAINDSSRFVGMDPRVWSFRVGGYQVCHKWLADRRRGRRELSQSDIATYCRMVGALTETMGLMQRVDDAIEAGGGWTAAAHW